MDFEQLRIFMVLAEERTFLGAANRLATSRSRVRRKLDQLESDAGTALVSREQSGLVLTPAGAALVRRGRTLLADADQLISHVRDVGNEPTGRLTIAMPIAPPPPGWDDACRVVQQQHPKLQLDFVYSDNPPSLLPANAEIALCFEHEIPESCRSVDLGEYALRLVASNRYLDRHGAPAEPADLASHRVGAWRVPGRPIEVIPLRDGQQLGFTPCLTSDDPLQIHRAVVAGDCIGYVPALPQLADPALKTLFPDQIAGSVTARLAVPNILADIPRVQRFLELTSSIAR